MESFTVQFVMFSLTQVLVVPETMLRPSIFPIASLTNVQSVPKRSTARIVSTPTLTILTREISTNKPLNSQLASFDLYRILGSMVSDPSDLMQYVTRDLQDKKFYCTICNVFSHLKAACTRNHVEAKHFPNVFSYECPVCSQSFHSKISLNGHKASKHKNV